MRRRAVLGAITTVGAGLAGCQTQRSSTGTTPETGVTMASYVVEKRAGETVAVDGERESVRFGGADATRVIQSAIDDLDGGRVFVRAGEYAIGGRGIALRSNVELVGEGRGATVLRLKDDINGRRGEVSSTVLNVGQTVENVVIADLEVDGNESGNREVPPYPMSPHHHGIRIHGHEPQVPEVEKPSNVTVRNVAVHDTVRSNVVLAGRNCALENLWLSNSATDHWLYAAGATHCDIRGVHASGFARTSGIVFGVGERRCYGNTLSDVTIADVARTPYPNEQGPGFAGEFPVRAFTMRTSSGNAHDNTVRDLDIWIPDAPAGSSVAVLQPDTRVENLSYRGPTGFGGILTVHPAGAGTTIDGVDVEITGRGRGGMRGMVTVSAPDVTVEDARIDAPEIESIPGVFLGEGPEPLARVALRDVRVAAGGPALEVNRGEYGVPNLVVDSFFDLEDSGVVGVDRIDPARMDVHS